MMRLKVENTQFENFMEKTMGQYQLEKNALTLLINSLPKMLPNKR